MRQYAASVDDSEKFISYRTNKLYLSLNMYRFFSHLTRQGFQKHSSRRYDTKNSMMRLLMKIGFISTTLHLPPLHFSSFHKCSISCQLTGLGKKFLLFRIASAVLMMLPFQNFLKNHPGPQQLVIYEKVISTTLHLRRYTQNHIIIRREMTCMSGSETLLEDIPNNSRSFESRLPLQHLAIYFQSVFLAV